MISASDRDALRAFINEQDVTITLIVSACGKEKRVTLSKSSHSTRVEGWPQELAYQIGKRMVELARDILHARGELEL